MLDYDSQRSYDNKNDFLKNIAMNKFKLGDKVRLDGSRICGGVNKIYNEFPKEKVDKELFHLWSWYHDEWNSFPYYAFEYDGCQFLHAETDLLSDEILKHAAAPVADVPVADVPVADVPVVGRIRAGKGRTFRSRKRKTFVEKFVGALKQSSVHRSYKNDVRPASIDLIVNDLLSVVSPRNFTKFGRRVFELAVRLAHSEGTKLITKNYMCLGILLIIRDSLEARKEYFGCVAEPVWMYPAIQYFWEQIRKEVKIADSPTGFALAEDVAAPLLSLPNDNQVSIQTLAHIYKLKRIHVLNGRSNVGVSFNG